MVASSASGSTQYRFQRGDLVGGKYRVERLLGEGAMGSVWSVTNELTERRFALKLVTPAGRDDPELKNRLLREARAAGRIAHRNVVEVYDVGQTADGSPFLVMQLLDGETLEERLRRAGPLAVADAIAIAAAIARGLVAAHTAGIVHRDLKPANVFLHRESDGAQVVKVVDFGVSKVLTATDSTSSITGLAVGSPAYMSPEQARGERKIDHRSDLWALGVLLFEMVSGSRPFDGETPYDTVAEILKGHIPSLAEYVPGADPGVERVVARCLQRRRDDRPASARELLDELELLLGGGRRAQLSQPSISLSARRADPERTEVLEVASEECDINDEDATIVDRSRALPIGASDELVEDTVPIADAANVSTVSPSIRTAPRLSVSQSKRRRSVVPVLAALGTGALVLWGVVGFFLVRSVGGSEKPADSVQHPSAAVSLDRPSTSATSPAFERQSKAESESGGISPAPAPSASVSAGAAKKSGPVWTPQSKNSQPKPPPPSPKPAPAPNIGFSSEGGG